MDKYLKVFHKFKPDIIKALLETLDMMVTVMILTAVLGLILGIILFSTREKGVLSNRLIYIAFSGMVNIFRSIPFILFIIAMIPINRLIIGTGFGVNASKIPLSIVGISTFARFVEQDLLDVNKMMYETSYALGANKIQYFKNFLLVEARSSLVLSFTSASISLLSYSTVMGIIGGGGLGYLAISEGYHNFNYELMWIIVLIMILIVQFIQVLGNFISNKIDQR
ncbi:MAG: ABC transporter permease subunit [Erysipelothrix sp.]|nr:ABC transporter permease subunit [Erysipelothrix sp.]